MVGSTESAAKAQKTRADNKIKYERITGFPEDARVRVDTPNERRYHSRTGTVATHHLGEIGVDFGTGSLVWFLSHQLVRL